METTQNTDTVVASSKHRSHTPKQCIAKGNQYSTSTKTNRLEKSSTKNIPNGLQEYAPHFVPGPLSYRTELKEKLTLKVGKIRARKLFLEIWQRQKGHVSPGTSTRSLVFQYITLTTTPLSLKLLGM